MLSPTKFSPHKSNIQEDASKTREEEAAFSLPNLLVLFIVTLPLPAAASSTIQSMPGDIAGQMQNIASVLASVGKLAKGNSFDAPTSVSAGTTATDLNISFD